MGNRKIKWLIYTVLVGLIPILARMLIWLVSKTTSIEAVNPSDFVAFGLVLHISNINEIEHFDSKDRSWKTIQNGVSITFIAFYSVLFAMSLFGAAQPAMVDIVAITRVSIALSLVSFFLSFSVYHRISKLSEAD